MFILRINDDGHEDDCYLDFIRFVKDRDRVTKQPCIEITNVWLFAANMLSCT